MDAAPGDSRAVSLAATALFRLGRVPDAAASCSPRLEHERTRRCSIGDSGLCLQKTDPNGEELRGLLPRYRLMKEEEAEALKRINRQEDELNKKMGK